MDATQLFAIKSILKLKNAGSNNKNVRFAPVLTTVKKFDSSSEPISISSNESSPVLQPLDFTKNGGLPRSAVSGGRRKFQLDCFYDDEYDSDTSIDDDLLDIILFNKNEDILSTLHDAVRDDDENEDERDEYDFEENDSDGMDEAFDFQIDCWRLENTNFVNDSSLASFDIFDNVRLMSLTHDVTTGLGNKLSGVVHVNNFKFEKFVEAKFSFNHWKDIHYIKANFERSINPFIDEFRFDVDLNDFKIFLQFKNLIYNNCQSNNQTTNDSVHTSIDNCMIQIDLCCRYQTDNQVFYDNNKGKNFQLNFQLQTSRHTTVHQQDQNQPYLNVIEQPSDKTHDFQTHRKFSNNTDYYNSSPLKHLYHKEIFTSIPTKKIVNQKNFLENSDFQESASSESIPSSLTNSISSSSSPSLNVLSLTSSDLKFDQFQLKKFNNENLSKIELDSSSTESDSTILAPQFSCSDLNGGTEDVQFSSIDHFNIDIDNLQNESSLKIIDTKKNNSNDTLILEKLSSRLSSPSPTNSEYEKLLKNYCFYSSSTNNDSRQTINSNTNNSIQSFFN